MGCRFHACRTQSLFRTPSRRTQATAHLPARRAQGLVTGAVVHAYLPCALRVAALERQT